MNIEDIEKFLKTKAPQQSDCIKISFKKRDALYGLFIKDNDYADLKSKNFWRIVTRHSMDEYNKSGNKSLARIFHGSEFTKLTLYNESFDEA